jgi:hypothetical protein
MGLKNLIKNFILENDENIVLVTPEEYTEVLDYVGGIASRVAMLKPYKGKGIVIDGDLDLDKFKNVGQLTGIVRVKGRLDISGTNVSSLDGITVDGRLSYHNSTMYLNKLKKEINKKLSELSGYREDNEWDVKNGDDDSERTEALYTFLMAEGIPDIIEYEDGTENEEDKYFIYPNGKGNYGYGKQYEWLGSGTLQPKIYDVYIENELDLAARRYVENIVDDAGIDSFSSWVWDRAIDRELWRRWLYDFYEDMIRDSPEDYDIPLELSENQNYQVEQLTKTIENLNNRLTNEELPDEKYEEIEIKIEDIEEHINEIKEDPQGDYDENLIEGEIESRVNDYIDNMQDFMSHYGYDESANFILDFVDLGELTDIIVDSDGYGQLLNSYDGEMYETKINNTWYHVMRVD